MRYLCVVACLLGLCAASCEEEIQKRYESGDRMFCIGGVTYMKIDRGGTVMLDKESHIIPCKPIP